MTKSSAQNQDKFVLRLPDGMRDRIKAAADANNRSMNAEIVATLGEKFPPPAVSPDIQAVADYMNFVESAESPEERDEFLRSANDSMQRDKATAGFMLGVTIDESGFPAVYITKRK